MSIQIYIFLHKNSLHRLIFRRKWDKNKK